MMNTKYLQESHRRMATVSLTTTFLLFSSLALQTALAKKPGGGGGGDDPVNPVPDLVAAPIGYTKTELVWKGDIDGNGIADRLEDTFRGVAFYGINNQGVVSSYINGPHPTDPLLLGRRIGGINIDPLTGSIEDEIFDLNVVFAAAVDAINLDRTDGPWRIAYGRGITDTGYVAVQLIPDESPRLLDATVPGLPAVANLNNRLESNAIMVLPVSPDGNNDIVQLTAGGSVLVLEGELDERFYRVFPLTERPSGEVGYFLEHEMPIPMVGTSDFGSIKDSEAGESFPEFIYTRDTQLNRKTSISQVVRHTYTWSGEVDGDGNRINDVLETSVLHEIVNGGSSLVALGFGTDGTAYGETIESGGKGGNGQTWSTPYHLLSPTERTPLAEPGVSARVPWRYWSISDAWISGEEEVTIRLEETQEFLVYKPNFGARFPVPVPQLNGWFLEISSPADHTAVTTGAGNYAAGYIGYGIGGTPRSTWVLTPDGASVPGAVED